MRTEQCASGDEPCLQVRANILTTLIPSCTILLAVIYDVFRHLRLPNVFQNALDVLILPFNNFIHLEDLDEADPVKPHRVLPSIWKIQALVILPALEGLGYVAVLSYNASISDDIGVLTAIPMATGWFYACLRAYLMSPSTTPYLLLLFNVAHVIAVTIDGVSDFSAGRDPLQIAMVDGTRLIIPLLLIWVIGTFPMNAVLPCASVALQKDTPSSTLSSPEDAVNLWQWLTFSFVEPIFEVAVRNRLDETDVWSLSPYFKHKNIFKKYISYRDRHPSHSLLRFLLTSNSQDLIIDLSLELYKAVAGYIPAYALQRILTALQDPTPENKRDAHIFAFITFAAHLSFAQFDLAKGWHTRRCYERTRGQLFCALHHKALKRRDTSGKVTGDEDGANNADLGKVVNLIQGDAYAVAHRFWQFSPFFAAPVRLAIALVFLYRVLGWSAMAGVLVVLIAYVFNYPLARYNLYVTRNSWKAKDKRMNGVNELFQNIRFLKFYGWENHWAGTVREDRETELTWRVKQNVVNTLISFIWTWIPSATALFSFLCYTLVAGQPLTVSKAFTALALFSQLQEPMTALPEQFFAILHAYISMQRIEGFLGEDEVEPWASSLKRTDEPGNDHDHIGFSDGVFEWRAPPNQQTPLARFKLGPLKISFPVGQVSLVTGATGSGKSALLAALLGEMHCMDGEVRLRKGNHRVAYCAQNPWLEHGTIRDNVIFGSTQGFNEDRYFAVIQACALERDLAMFDAGDQTEIGERGVTLSGGQRARVALARAIYSEASVSMGMESGLLHKLLIDQSLCQCILLDDPLAAVDMHTAQHLVTACLAGDLVRGRTVILVTHHISLCLPVSTFVVELSHGIVLRQGLVEDLQALGELQSVIEDEDDTTMTKAGDETPCSQSNLDPEQSSPPQRTLSDGKLVDAEARAEGRVSVKTYLTYIKAAGWFNWILTLCLIFLIRVISIGTDLFLAKWGEAYEQGRPESFWAAQNIIAYTPDLPFLRLPSPEVDPKPWLLIYLWISIASAVAMLAYISLGYYSSLRASRSLFLSMLLRLTRAPARFFDITPIGRILNRFTADINTVDDALQGSARAALLGWLSFTTSFLFIVWVIPQFAPFALFIAWLYIRLAPVYVKASRDLRRLESVSFSPAFAGFDELLRGLSHVRAFAMEQRYQDRFYQRVDTFQNFDHVYWLVSGWLRWRYDCLGSVVVYVTTLFALLTGLSDGFAALVIVRAGVFAEASRQLVKVLAQLELDFNSVERIVEYLQVPQEALAIIKDKRPPAYWPSSNGDLIVDDLVVQYAPDLPPVLNGLSFSVKPGEKIGVVGRTGSGKSTLALSLLRIIEPVRGKIILDGVDLTTIGLEDLRTRITIVSQDVSLFTGTVRSNLDPFGEHTDHECWDVLRRCHLTNELSVGQTGHIKSLDMAISSSGSMSAGERQLVALARAILRRTQLIIMDEATSQIDQVLDDEIQRTIREELSEAMIITIAHRLKTIVDYDRILVLGPGGEILEFDTPAALLSKQGGAFREMCRRSADWDTLRRIVSA